MKTENRKFWASLLMLAIVVGLVGYLTFLPVPPDNKDIIITVLGVLLGGASAAMPNLFGSKDTETDALKKELAAMRLDHDLLKRQYHTLKAAYDEITASLINRHVVRKRAPKGAAAIAN